MSAVIRVQGVSKRYHLGSVNRRMLYEEMQSRWALWRGRPDPNLSLDARAASGHGEIWALRDVHLDVEDGDVLGIIGRNGSGKSTLLKILSQITAPTTGRVLIKGRIASLLEVGTGFHPELTGRDNVYLNGVILGMTHKQVAARFDQIVEFSGVETFIDTPVKHYSSGMRVRLAFAVAAHLDPEILIIDEVLAVGDQVFQRKCLGKINEVARAGRTVIFVSHNAAAVENLCTHGVVLDRGRLTFSGTQAEALEYYANSSESEITGDLRQRQDRSGSGAVRVVAIEFRNAAGRPVQAPTAGSDLELWLHFENPSRNAFPNLIATVRVKTHFDAPVFLQQNRLTGDSFGPIGESGAFVCRIPRLPLTPGGYRVGFVLSSELRGGELLDSIAEAVDLHVEAGDFFGTGQLPAAQSGPVLVEAKWRRETAPSPGSHAG